MKATLPAPFFVNSRIGRFALLGKRDEISVSLYQNGDFEPLPRRIFAGLFPAGGATVIDVGANIGTFAIPIAMMAPSNRVHAYEPQRVVFYQLCANALLNRCANLFAERIAIGARRAGAVRLPVVDFETETNIGAVSIDPSVWRIRSLAMPDCEPALRARAFDKVRIASLDGLHRDTAVDFIKIDVEGMEAHVLRGAAGMIGRWRPIIFTESWVLPEFAHLRREMLSDLGRLDYKVIDLGPDLLAYPRQGNRWGEIVRGKRNLVSFETGKAGRSRSKAPVGIVSSGRAAARSSVGAAALGSRAKRKQ
jgi:FkbM family methyltransferase